jgi:uncharacterized membrane protein YecN with MAPEG domain
LQIGYAYAELGLGGGCSTAAEYGTAAIFLKAVAVMRGATFWAVHCTGIILLDDTAAIWANSGTHERIFSL